MFLTDTLAGPLAGASAKNAFFYDVLPNDLHRFNAMYNYSHWKYIAPLWCS